jgi:transcriptional regulator with XRE-family HTH domain
MCNSICQIGVQTWSTNGSGRGSLESVDEIDTRRLGRVLRVLREARGLDQKQLDDLSGISQSQISRYERGLIERPTLHDLVALARGLGVSVNYLTSQAGIDGGTVDESTDILAGLMADDDFAVEVVRLSAGYQQQTPEERAFILDALRAFARRYGTQNPPKGTE